MDDTKPDFRCDWTPKFRRRLAVESAFVATLAYDPMTPACEVIFKSGVGAIYYGMSAEGFAAWLNAPSIGAHFHAEIRGRYQSERIERMAVAS